MKCNKKSCGKIKFSSSVDYVQHLKTHKYEKNILFTCPHQKCCACFRTFSAFKSHIHRFHRQQQKQLESDENDNSVRKMKCLNCKKDFNTSMLLLEHVKEVHFTENSNCSVNCFLCGQPYKTYSAYKSHLYKQEKFHKLSKYGNNLEVFDKEDENNDLNITSHNFDCSQINEEIRDKSTDDFCVQLDNDYFKQLNKYCDANIKSNDKTEDYNYSEHNFAEFLMFIEGVLLVPISTIDLIIEKMGNIFNFITQALIRDVILIIKNNDEKLSGRIKELILLLQKNNIIHLEKFDNDYKRKKFFSDNFNYIPPEIINISNSEDKIYYVSPINTLKNLLTDKKIQEIINTPYQSEHGILKRLKDGNMLKNNNFFTKNPDALQLELYIDEYTTVSQSCSTASKHKFSGLYFSLGNIPPEYSASRYSIYMISVIPSDFFNKYKQSDIFDQLLKDLELLKQGIFFDSINKTLKGAISVIFGDNKSQNSLGGYIECFKINQEYCRFCIMSEQRLRTKQDFESTLQLILENQKSNEFNNKKNEKNFYPDGIKRNCVFNQDSFHCTNGLPSCNSHDVFEGICHKDLPSYVSSLIKKKYFSIEDLNKEIPLIFYDNLNEIERPQNRFKNGEINAHAIETVYFVKYLIVFLKKKNIPLHLPEYRAIILIYEIICFMLAPVLSLDQTSYFDGLYEVRKYC